MKKGEFKRIIISVSCLFLFFVLLLVKSRLKFADYYFYIFSKAYEHSLAYNIMNFVTFFGSQTAMIAILIISTSIFVYHERHKDGIRFILFLSGYFLYFLKYIIKSLPPPESANVYSFPSGHTLGAGLFAWGLIYILKPKNKLVYYSLLLFPFVIGATRIFLLQHWLTDVIASFLLALFWIIIIEYVFKKLENKNIKLKKK